MLVNQKKIQEIRLKINYAYSHLKILLYLANEKNNLLYSWAGAWGGAALGAKGGAVVGSFFGPGPGTAVGGFVGGIGGGLIGAFGGSWLSEKAVETVIEKK